MLVMAKCTFSVGDCKKISTFVSVGITEQNFGSSVWYCRKIDLQIAEYWVLNKW